MSNNPTTGCSLEHVYPRPTPATLVASELNFSLRVPLVAAALSIDRDTPVCDRDRVRLLRAIWDANFLPLWDNETTRPARAPRHAQNVLQIDGGSS